MRTAEARAGISTACLQCPEEVRKALQDSRKPLPVGIRLEDLSSVLERSAIRHTSGARAVLSSERAYQGGPSAADKMDL